MAHSWYSFSVTLKDAYDANPPAEEDVGDQHVMFKGYVVVDNATALVTSVYETVNGKTDTSTNLLSAAVSGGTPTDTYLGFSVYEEAGFSSYDNAYLAGWLQFDTHGIFLNRMSAYPNHTRFNLRANDFGEESTTNSGVLQMKDASDQQSSVNTYIEMAALASPPTLTLSTGAVNWYSVQLQETSTGRALFHGYFYVDHRNYLLAMYETNPRMGIPNLKNNLLVPNVPGTTWWGKTDTGFNIGKSNDYFYDNAYVSSWKQFDTYGIVVRGMSAYPQYTSINWYASNTGDETTTNVGSILLGSSLVVGVTFHISPMATSPREKFAVNSRKKVSNHPENPNSHSKRNLVSVCGSSVSCTESEPITMVTMLR